MPIPLAIAVPAAAASLAYLNAKTQFGYDFILAASLVKSRLRASAAEKKDRVNLFYKLEEHAHSKHTADRTFLVYEGKSWTFKETYDIVLKYGTWMKTTYGIGPKEVVALDFQNSAQFLFVWFALWAIGANPAFINYNLTSKPLLHCIKTSSARIVFVDEGVKSQFSSEVLDELSSTSFRDGKGSVEVVYVGEDVENKVMAVQGARETDSSRAGVEGLQMAILIYTSGTTGNPKPAIVNWIKLYTAGNFMETWLPLKKTDRYYTCMPVYHSTATILGVIPCLYIGTTLILGHKFSNRTFWPEVRANNATIIQYVGESCRYLLAAPPQIDPMTGENMDKKNDVRLAFGNGLRPDVWDRFKERFGIETIAEFYSATEGAGATWNLSSNSYAAGAVGRHGTLVHLLLYSKAAIVEVDLETELPKRDPKNHNFCTRVPTNTPGELLYGLEPDNIEKNYAGYYGNEKASKSKIMRDVLSKGDAWFRTGDIVRMDHDHRTWFCDRIGDTFRWKSENVSTNEVSEVLGVHPAIVDANVYGVELPNHDGRAGCVATVFNGEVNQQLLHDVAVHASKKLPRYAVPLFLRVTKEVQATGNNKRQKHVLRKQGVDPAKVDGGDEMFWLRDGGYVRFDKRAWDRLRAGEVKL